MRKTYVSEGMYEGSGSEAVGVVGEGGAVDEVDEGRS